MARIGWAALPLAGCASALDQLEAIEVRGDVPPEAVQVQVDGTSNDYVLTDGAGLLDLSVHSPTGADLRSLDGLLLRFEYDGISELDEISISSPRLTWRASDDQPRWLVYRNGATTLVDDWFGAGFAALGDVQARQPLGGRLRRDHYSAVFRTDSGEVSLLPGEVQSVELDGVSWQLGLVAAYHDEDRSGSKCAHTLDYLAYELIRAEGAEPRTVAPDPEREVATDGGSCG